MRPARYPSPGGTGSPWPSVVGRVDVVGVVVVGIVVAGLGGCAKDVAEPREAPAKADVVDGRSSEPDRGIARASNDRRLVDKPIAAAADKPFPPPPQGPVLDAESLAGVRVGMLSADVTRLLGPPPKLDPIRRVADGGLQQRRGFSDRGLAVLLAAPSESGPWKVYSLVASPPGGDDDAHAHHGPEGLAGKGHDEHTGHDPDKGKDHDGDAMRDRNFRPAMTARGIRVGSTEAELRQAYAGRINASLSRPGLVVVGTLEAGLFFRVEDGRVSRLMLGALQR